MRRLMEQGEQDVPTPTPAAPAPARAAVASAGPEARVHFGSRMQPALQTLIHQTSVELRGQLGRRVLLERVLEAIMEEYRDDPALRDRVARRIAED